MGPLIAVCGIDGAGKTTQIARIASYLGERFPDVVTTRQPTDLYRQDPIVRAALNLDVTPESVAEELALFSAFDRIRHVREEIIPVLQRGGAVISDRYVYSAFAYFLARGISDIEWLKQINRAAPVPDVTLYIDVDPEQAIRRILQRDGSSRKREEIDLDRMNRVRSAFVEQPWGKRAEYYRIDGTGTAGQVWEAVKVVLDVNLPLP
jgi:dTMP kinase